MSIILSVIFLLINIYIYYSYSKTIGSYFNILIFTFAYTISFSFYLATEELINYIDFYCSAILSAFALYLSFSLNKNRLLKSKHEFSSNIIPYSRSIFWVSIFIILTTSVTLIIILNGAPLLSLDPNNSRLEFIANHSYLARIINYVIPFVFFISICFYNKSTSKGIRIVNYILLFLSIFPTLLLSNKSSITSFLLLVLIFDATTFVKHIFNRKILISCAIFAMFFLFSLHFLENSILNLMLQIKNRLIDYSGVKVVYDYYVPQEGYAYGKTILYEINSIFSSVGLTDNDITQTTGNFISRWYHGFGNDYLFEYVFPIFTIGFLNGGMFFSFLLSFIFSYLIFYFYSLYRCENISIVKVFYFLLSYTMLQIYITGKPGSFIVSNISTYIVVAFISIVIRSIFLRINKV
ncbi:hypothetical protein AB7W14_07190 [Providencia rettgeri]